MGSKTGEQVVFRTASWKHLQKKTNFKAGFLWTEEPLVCDDRAEKGMEEEFYFL